MAMRPRRPSFRTQPTLHPVYQDFKPKSEMKENPEAHVLQILLPGFTRERIRVQFQVSSQKLKVSGERPIDGFSRGSRFREAYPVPQNCNIDKIHSNFNQGILTITMPKKLISQAQVETTQEQVIPPKSAREEPRDKETASSPSTSGTGPDDMKTQKSQEEIPSQRPSDSKKPEKELRAMIPSEKQADGEPQKVQEEPEQKLILKTVPRKQTDEEPRKDQKEIELMPEITMAATQEKQADKTQKVREETEQKPALKMDPTKAADQKLQKGREENVQMRKAPENQIYDKPQKVQQEIEPKSILVIAPRKPKDEKLQKGQEETEPKPAVTMVPVKPEEGQEGTKQHAELTLVTRKQADEKTAARRAEDAEKERISNKEITEGKPSESRKPENGVVENNMDTEKEIRARELAKTEELSVPKTHEKDKETNGKTAAAAVANEWNLNDGMIDAIGKGIKEVTTSTSQAFTRIAEGKWDDQDKPFLLNMGASILVLAAVGIYAFYRFSSSERT